MAIYTKAKSGENVVDGCATVCTGKRTSLYNNTDRNKTYANINSLRHVVVAEDRYKIAPSGWSE